MEKAAELHRAIFPLEDHKLLVEILDEVALSADKLRDILDARLEPRLETALHKYKVPWENLTRTSHS